MKTSHGYPRSAYVLIPVAKALCTVFYGLLFRLSWSGLHNVPRDRPVMLAPNHQSWLDPPMVAIPLQGLRFRAMAQSRYFKNRWLAGLILSLGGFPIDLSARLDRKAYQMCVSTLKDGVTMIVFPEGTRTRDGDLGTLLPGTARMAMQAGVDIVPVAITGAYETWPRHRKTPRLFGPAIQMKFYPPIRVSTPADRARQGEVANEITERLRARLDRRLRARRRLEARRQGAKACR